jgi:LysM repeat protein/lipoprotein-anchoring transpeptidase ErfK/SrfK
MDEITSVMRSLHGLIIFAALLALEVNGATFRGVEPGLEEAVGWKWSVEPAPVAPITAPARGRNMSLPAAPTAPTPPTGSQTHTVVRGEALAKIARRYGITVQQLKYANDLTSDLIRVGQILRIPGPQEIARMPAPPPGRTATEVPPANALPPGIDPVALRLQIFLDRQNFSPGPIDGVRDIRFQKLVISYLTGAGIHSNPDELTKAAFAALPDPLTTYRLRNEDMFFIKPGTSMEFNKMAGAPASPYRSSWDFVAERFHCSEAFLRALNPRLPREPTPGTLFRVPAVEPFEIEHDVSMRAQLSSPPEGKNIVAAIVDLSSLQILQGGMLVASFPIAVARPGLRGRGTWNVLNGFPWPEMTTQRKPRVAPPTFTQFDAQGRPIPPKATSPVLPPLTLPAGPRNPVGVYWINLAKADDPSPLPFGLHGTAVPDQMSSLEGLGGFRMANWDIIRAAKWLAPGTPLRWTSESPAISR